MSAKQLNRTLKNKFKQLYNYKYEENNCLFLTIKGLQNLTWKENNDVFKNFARQIKRNFGEFEYIKTIECNAKEGRFHIHIILIFDKGIPSKLTNKKWFQKHCKYEITVKKVYNIYNLLSYITSFYNELRNIKDETFTKYNKGARIITCSRGLKKDDKTTLEVDNSFYDVVNYYVNKYSCDSSNIKIDSHSYYDNNLKKICKKIDTIYIYNVSNLNNEKQIKCKQNTDKIINFKDINPVDDINKQRYTLCNYTNQEQLNMRKIMCVA